MGEARGGTMAQMQLVRVRTPWLAPKAQLVAMFTCVGER
jgi:hypothetical protein